MDETSEVYFIVSGLVRVIIYSAAGKEVAFRDLGSGQSFGELSAIDGGGRSANVVARADSQLAAMPAERFRHMLRDHPEAAGNIMQHLVGMVRKLSDRVVEFSVLAVRNRIHAEMLRLARDHAGDRDDGGNEAVLGE